MCNKGICRWRSEGAKCWPFSSCHKDQFQAQNLNQEKGLRHHLILNIPIVTIPISELRSSISLPNLDTSRPLQNWLRKCVEAPSGSQSETCGGWYTPYEVPPHFTVMVLVTSSIPSSSPDHIAITFARPKAVLLHKHIPTGNWNGGQKWMKQASLINICSFLLQFPIENNMYLFYSFQ